MNKEEILQKSRNENCGQDMYEHEVMEKGAALGTISAAIVASIFFILQIVLGQGQNYGLYAIVGAILTTQFLVRSIYLKRKHEIAVAIMYLLLTLACSVAHIFNLIEASRVL